MTLIPPSGSTSDPWTTHPTGDGSVTFFSPEFGEYFHSDQGAKTEALTKFVQGTDLPDRLHHWDQSRPLRWLDICYGLGYNTAAALETVACLNPRCAVEAVGLEWDPRVPLGAVEGVAGEACLGLWGGSVPDILRQLAQTGTYGDDRHDLRILWGDARQTLPTLVASGWQADVIFLDPFSPRRCPHLWTVEFLQGVKRCLGPGGKVATYCRAAAVRGALGEVGFAVGTLPLEPSPGQETPVQGGHHWSQGTIAAHPGTPLIPLSPLEQEHLHTRAAIPYRDPTLADSPEAIVARRQQEQARSSLESTSQWRKRWGIT